MPLDHNTRDPIFILIATRPEYLEQKSNFVPVSYTERKACCILYCNFIKFSSRFRLEDTGSRPDRVKCLDTIYCVHFVPIKLFTGDTSDIFKYSLISLLHASASITPSTGSFTATFKTYHENFPLKPQGCLCWSHVWPKSVWRTDVCWRLQWKSLHTKRDGTSVQTASMHHSITSIIYRIVRAIYICWCLTLRLPNLFFNFSTSCM